MKYNTLKKYVSDPRLNRYLVACKKSKKRAQKLYAHNLRISQSYYPVLNLFEVFVRNAINVQLTSHFQDPDWIKNQRNEFMSNEILDQSRYYLKKSIIKSIRRLGSNASSGKIISEQSFGFWTALFLPHHYRLVGGSIIDCFPNKPSEINRSGIYIRLKAINDFRNRVYHNEPICFLEDEVSFLNVKRIHIYIKDLTGWMDSDLLIYLNKFDFVDSKILKAESIFLEERQSLKPTKAD